MQDRLAAVPLAAPRLVLHQELHGRERAPDSVAIRSSSNGVLVLDEDLQVYSAMPSRLLDSYTTPSPHYLDLGGIRATCLLDFGGAPPFWGNLTKLYASRCKLHRLDGIAALTRIQYLYLDHNLLPEKEILRLLSDLPGAAHRLEALDVTSNIGCTPEVETRLHTGLHQAQWINGLKKRRGSFEQWDSQV
mmetsp:Transcript_42108/g.70260  ORF Transcript_42108/g.70260 Transcript_42108/m.70260 type:complete len:190 (+) Transcript_42108:498-1067(+)|eukprot:CAMPEP_0198206368 /NCGR_PEP_ID=MMETSP1445-20131203/9900_1 /TAXON_ID=36898 /ORGANISM="Pyramimonas sp., Strain CCMP2087" /LENGTH=189 /DNA_ID=CAMNT_0043879029 /DNA_START=399 /DNA_END=968 /DNA_ORIENTATION=+